MPVSAKFRVSNLAYELGELASALALACERAVAHTLVTRASNVAANRAWAHTLHDPSLQVVSVLHIARSGRATSYGSSSTPLRALPRSVALQCPVSRAPNSWVP